MNGSIRLMSGVFIVANFVFIAIALHLWGAAEIRSNAGEVFFLTFAGAIWLMIAMNLFAWGGLSFRDDALERRNLSALVALSGAVLAINTIYAGASIGEGPSYFNNLFCVALGTSVFFALWILLEIGA